MRRGPEQLLVFATRYRNVYTNRRFKALWQRIMQWAMSEGIVPREARLRFHDLRAFYTSEYETRTCALPDLHKTPATTAEIYERAAEAPRKAIGELMDEAPGSAKSLTYRGG